MLERAASLVADMPTGIILMARPDAANLVDDVIAQARGAYEHGVTNVIAREQVAGAVELAAIGPEDLVVQQLRRYLDAGATDLVISPIDRSASVDREALGRVTAAV
ncbi:hypothetical protein AWC03_21850 [Mycobacterium europaeum]|uniref:hypothetical protein n=1 Tax=Mycobacterium europaeum TaxID=761804 RepID=UPI000A265CB5|nr:hypothetical protein [Mycobacterium europaeum]ORV51728.1 hypothetical protein AWC03_21850 [Mycobacterium europaeum]